jgi:four helix bundle protein
MATFQKFEELEIWQLSRKLSQIVYNFTMKAGFSKEYALKDKIKRSIGSVMDNIAEGFDRNGNAEFIHFLTIAKGSVAEVQSQ